VTAEPGAVTQDTLLRGRVKLRQPAAGYRVALDPVLLAAAVAARPDDTVLDAGAGSGAATLCLAARVPAARIVGLELQPRLAGLAAESVRLNGWQDRVRITTGDLLDPAVEPGPFAIVMSNPPFGDPEGTAPPERSRALAHVATVPVTRWLEACLARLHPRGRIVLVDRPERLPAILATLAARCGDLRLLPVLTTPGSQRARRVIVAARRGARGPMRVLRGLDLQGVAGQFSERARAVLEDMATLDLEA
jgi:tRNA1(Val) A37 N6-methylase TrmN6